MFSLKVIRIHYLFHIITEIFAFYIQKLFKEFSFHVSNYSFKLVCFEEKVELLWSLGRRRSRRRRRAKTLTWAYYSKSIKGINMKLWTFDYYDKTHLSDKGYNSEINIFGVMPLFNLDFFVRIIFFYIGRASCSERV